MSALLSAPVIPARAHEITTEFTRLVHAHVDDVVAGRVTEMLEVRDFAALLFVHPTHLSNTLKLTTGEAPCAIYERKLVAVAKELLADPRRKVAAVAAQLTYDPSNFTKFFKRFVGLTPRQYREELWAAQRREKTELLTN